jgi:tRNA (guanine-N7-)-methyltransferase
LCYQVAHFEAFPLFKRLTDAELEGDPVVPLVLSGTEEGRKVDRIAGAKYLAVYRRVDPEASPSS